MSRSAGFPSGPLRAVGAISLATAISRVLGLARDQVLAFYFGAGAATDAFFAAFRIPNLLRDLFAEGALSSAFVPVVTREFVRRGRAAAWALANRLFTVQLLGIGALSLAIAWLARPILHVYVAGFDAAKLELAVSMTRIMAPFLLCVALAAAAMGLLNACGRFFLPALAPAAFNAIWIVCVVGLYPVLQAWGQPPALALAWGALAGGAFQFVVQWPGLWREGFRPRLEWAPRDPALRDIGRRMLPATFGLAATQINLFVDTVLASFLGDAPLSWLAYGFRIMYLPLGLFGVALGTANLAFVSRDLARGDRQALRATLAGALRAAGLLLWPAVMGLLVLREPIVRVLFERGAFTESDTQHTAAALACYALGLYPYAVTKIQVPTFYALDDTRLPVIASATGVAVKVGANLALIVTLPWLGFEAYLALALSTALGAWVNGAVLARALRRRVGTLAEHGVRRGTLQAAALALAMGGLCALLERVLERLVPGVGLVAEALRLALVIAAGVAVVVLGARALRMPEAERLLALGRRGPRSRPG